MHALFPISLSSGEFSTARYMQALNALPARPTKSVFLIADQIHAYNWTMRRGLAETLRRFPKISFQSERERWIARITPALGRSFTKRNVVVIGVDSLADGDFVRILRNIRLLYECDVPFRNDVHSSAQRFVSLQEGLVVPMEVAIGLSCSYILEEIALNLRLRVLDSLDSEFYPGKYPDALVNLYTGRYRASVFELVGRRKTRMTFDFYSLTGHRGRPIWKRL